MFINTTQREDIKVSLLAAQMQDCQPPLPEVANSAAKLSGRS